MALKTNKKKAARPVAAKEPVAVVVFLPGAPKVVVYATTRDKAYEKYKAVCGINGSDHQPRFERPGEDTLVNEHGVVCDPTGVNIFGELSSVPLAPDGAWLPDEDGVDAGDAAEPEVE